MMGAELPENHAPTEWENSKLLSVHDVLEKTVLCIASGSPKPRIDRTFHSQLA